MGSRANGQSAEWLLPLIVLFGRQDMIETRKATRDDKGFLWELKVASMREYVEVVFGWDDALHDGLFETGFHPEDIHILRCAKLDMGMYELQ